MDAFLLGVYPSALHVRWTHPQYRVAALAVAEEPYPFWDGADEVERVDRWRGEVGWQSEWGTAEPVGRLNGSSGGAGCWRSPDMGASPRGGWPYGCRCGTSSGSTAGCSPPVCGSVRAPRTEPWGLVEMWIEDPDGVGIVLVLSGLDAGDPGDGQRRFVASGPCSREVQLGVSRHCSVCCSSS